MPKHGLQYEANSQIRLFASSFSTVYFLLYVTGQDEGGTNFLASISSSSWILQRNWAHFRKSMLSLELDDLMPSNNSLSLSLKKSHLSPPLAPMFLPPSSSFANIGHRQPTCCTTADLHRFFCFHRNFSCVFVLLWAFSRKKALSRWIGGVRVHWIMLIFWLFLKL